MCLNVTLFHDHWTDGANTGIKGGKVLRIDEGYSTVLDNKEKGGEQQKSYTAKLSAKHMTFTYAKKRVREREKSYKNISIDHT